MLTLMQGDCIDIMRSMEHNSVDLFLCDPPYGTTCNKWDSILPLDELWVLIEKLLVKDGTVIFTAAEPFSSLLITSNIDNFKYEVIWKKTIGSGQLNIKHRPLVVHEKVLVFYKTTKSVYNPILTKGTPYSINRKGFKESNYRQTTGCTINNTGTRQPTSVIEISNPRIKGGHPTQKPVKLFEYLIDTYSNPGQTVCDFCMGSGSSGIAAILNGRDFIGIEKDEEYFNKARYNLEVTNKHIN